MTLDVDREAAFDAIVAMLMTLYGIAVLGDNPAMSVAAWLIAGLFVLRHTVEPVEEFVDENQLAFFLLLLTILIVGFLLS